MARKAGKKVAESWICGKPAQGHGSIRTDGCDLFSYNLLIGTTENGKKILFDYTRGGVYMSATTSKHVGYARTLADDIRQPPTKE